MWTWLPQDPANSARLAAGERRGVTLSWFRPAPVCLATGEGGGGGTNADLAAPIRLATEEGGGGTAMDPGAHHAPSRRRGRGHSNVDPAAPMCLATVKGGEGRPTVDPAAPHT